MREVEPDVVRRVAEIDMREEEPDVAELDKREEEQDSGRKAGRLAEALVSADSCSNLLVAVHCSLHSCAGLCSICFADCDVCELQIA